MTSSVSSFTSSVHKHVAPTDWRHTYFNTEQAFVTKLIEEKFTPDLRSKIQIENFPLDLEASQSISRIPKMPQPKPPEAYRKPCTLCATPRDVLVRCQIDRPVSSSPGSDESRPDGEDESSNPAPGGLKPGAWHFVCPGACWKRVSGGVIDGDLKEGREGYRYGGMWKNKHAGVSAKVPKRLKGKMVRGAEGKGGEGEGDGIGDVEGEA